MSYYRHTQVRASFTDCNVKAGKIVLKFEVGADDRYTLPTLALLTGEKVTLDIASDQEPVEDQMTIDEEIEEGADDEPEEDDDSDGQADLPPAAQEYDAELDDIFGTESAA